MSASLRVHDQLFAETISKFSGYVFATAGDSFAAAFQRASAAIECAEAIQRALAAVEWGTGPALSVRIGLHVGEAEERDGNFFGPAVNQTARVMAVAHGGQCLLTDGVRDAARVAAADLGVHVLRDIEMPVHLNQLGAEEFPPLWSVGRGIVSLPSPRTSLVGREEAVEEVRKLVDAHRLVTLTGVGGCGKTRLAIEVAYREVPSHPDGVWFVDLSTIADRAALSSAFVTALGLTAAPDVDPIDQIAAYLAPREALIVVDNCEHMVDGVVERLDELFGACSRLRVLATSRESLDLDGEFTWKVPSLTTSEDASATQLFIDRAQAAGTVLRLDDATLTSVVEIVTQLDGIPLAIELAAARTRSMDVAEIRSRLDDRFRLLSGATRLSRQRQATLEGAVQWSYGLLSEAEQSMLQTLSVFQGGFALEDVAGVADLGEYEAIDLVDALSAKSLIDLTRDRDGQLRHRLLETVRLFGRSRLIESGETNATRDRHLEHFANEYDRSAIVPEDIITVSSVQRFGREYENYRSAAAWAVERGRPEDAAWIAVMLNDTASSRGEVQQIVDWLTLPTPTNLDDQIRIAADLAWALTVQGNIEGSEAAAETAIALGETHPTGWVAIAKYVRCLNLILTGDIENAERQIRSGLTVARDLSGVNVYAFGMNFLGVVLNSRLAFNETIIACDAALTDAPEMGHYTPLEAYRAWALLADGRVQAATDAVAAFRPVPLGSSWAHLLALVAHFVMAHTDGAEAATRSFAANIEESVRRRPQLSSDVLQGFACLAYLRGDQERAHEIVAQTAPLVTVQFWSWLILDSLGATSENARDTLAAYNREHPINERYALFAQNGARLLAEELERWS
jgi:predicted ATPase